MMKPGSMLLVGVIVMLSVLPAPCGAGDCQPGPEVQQTPAQSLANDWGIQVESLRLSANGYMIDFRYKVVDPKKALALASREFKPYLIDEASGAKFLVPKTPKVGPLRQTAQNLSAGKTYWMLFSNPGKFVKTGNKVTVVIGDFRVEHMKISG
jgi:hypothetical protein